MTIALLEHIKVVPEHRGPGMATYSLDEILLSPAVGVLCGGDDWASTRKPGKHPSKRVLI